jgi:TRAP-type C4-dicarboxylate transport system substrate-binding protein
MANLMACKIRGCPNTMTHSAYLVRPICNDHWTKLPPELRTAILQARHEGPRRVAETLNEAQKELADGI